MSGSSISLPDGGGRTTALGGWPGRVLIAVGLAVGIAAIGLDARAGSLHLGPLQAAGIFGGYLVLSLGTALVLGRMERLAGDVARTTAIGLQLLVLAAAVAALQIENPAFYRVVVPLGFAGFLFHHALPPSLRQPFFVVLSFAAIGLVFGPADAAWLVGLGLALIAACHLPIPWLARVGVLLALGGAYAWLRAGVPDLPWSAAVWPILGSMFMFRLIAYIYHLKHAKERPGGWRVLSYFFLLPNVTFPLFPVVDFKTFERTYYRGDPHGTYQRGVRWMLLGVAHLVAYRLVYHHVVLPETDVGDLLGLSRQMTGTFLLYLRVSGQFHFIVGMLHLFGYALPETHRFFFLSSDFNDFWRRINIYWKDFMMKTFYYPSVFATKRYGMPIAIVVATVVCVFLLNWIFHAYQWFWILGVTPISWTDTLFWAVLTVAVVANGLWEYRRGRARSLGGPVAVTWPKALGRAARTVGFFVTMSILWSIWTTPTFEQWLTLVEVDVSAADVALLVGVALASAVGLSIFFHRRGAALVDGSARSDAPFSTARAARGLASGVALLTLASPATFSWASTDVQRFAQSLRVDQLNRADSQLLTRGYYEQLTGVNKFNGQLWSVYASRSEAEWDPLSAGLLVYGDHPMRQTLEPLFGELAPHGWVTTNSEGMRDREYARERTPGTFRIALEGPSYIANLKVADGESFDALAEARLATELARGARDGRAIEVLNFGVPNYSPLQQLLQLELKVTDFSPDVAIFAANQRDLVQGLSYLGWVIATGATLPPREAGFVADLARRAGVDSTQTGAAVASRLASFRQEILEWTYREFVARCRALGIEPVWLYVPLAEPFEPETIEPMRAAAEAAGFRIFDLQPALDGQELPPLQVSEADFHLNARGNALLVDDFAAVLRELEAGARGAPRFSGEPPAPPAPLPETASPAAGR